jgi:hypothetical protein
MIGRGANGFFLLGGLVLGMVMSFHVMAEGAQNSAPQAAQSQSSDEDMDRRVNKQEREEAIAAEFWERRKQERERLAEEARRYAEQQQERKGSAPASSAPIPVAPRDSSSKASSRCVFKPVMTDAEIAACRAGAR